MTSRTMSRMRTAASSASASSSPISTRAGATSAAAWVKACSWRAAISTLAMTADSGLLISWATPAASRPTDAMRSEIRSCSCIALRSRRMRASRSSRSIAGPSRASLLFDRKSWAPARIASTAVSSSTVPDAMISGRSSALVLSISITASALNDGMVQSVTTTSHGSRSRAAAIASGVSTRTVVVS